MLETVDGESVFLWRAEGEVQPTVLARGPWSETAQHGGAPAALLVHAAEKALGGPGWLLSRMTLELLRPVPVAPLRLAIRGRRGRSVRRAEVTLKAGDCEVARGVAVLMREEAIELGAPAVCGPRLPPPADCTEPVRIPGMPDARSFHYTAMESRVAAGSVTRPGPAAVWFRLTVPLVDGVPNSPAMRVMAAADFGNGISWVLPPDRFTFVNTDLTVHLHRAPVGEWVGVDATTVMQPHGVGLTTSRLVDELGEIGIAMQGLVVRQRAAAAA
ncbi:thioesterase family protein [Tistrella mobilis]|nr:thioesterase family protein [Tistrella mobilis]